MTDGAAGDEDRPAQDEFQSEALPDWWNDELPAELLREERPAEPAALVGALSGLIGAFTSAWLMPTWQVAVESAQVLSGAVAYPAENAFYQYHVQTWTLAHQVPALLIAAGVSEYSLSWSISAVLGGLMFAAVSLCTFALSRSAVLSLLAPLHIFALFGGRDIYGVVYPLYLMGTHHTYGVLGLGVSLFTLALWAMQWRRAAAVLLAVGPALHLTWGCWTLLVVATERLWRMAARGAAKSNERRARMWPWLILGGAVTAASYGWQRWRARGLPAVDAALARQYRDAFLQSWDGHRQPVDLLQPGVWLTAAAALLCAVFLARRGWGDADGRRMLRLVMISSAGALAAAALTRVPVALPAFVEMLMPGRFANLSIVALPAVLAGLLAAFQRHAWVRVMLAAFVLYPIANWPFFCWC